MADSTESPGDPPRADEHRGDGVARSTKRMEAYADAVFAIAFTLPILAIKLPEPGPRYGAALLALWPSYLGYVLSALVIGIFWVHHHFSGAIYRTATHYFGLATLLFLAAIAFIAFPTRAFAEHLPDPDARVHGAHFYVAALGATAVTWWIKWRTGKALGDVDHRLEPGYVARLDRKYAVTTLLMLAAVALVFVRWEAGLALAAAVILYYLRAPETPKYLTEAPPVQESD